jgi:hypothetical protein
MSLDPFLNKIIPCLPNEIRAWRESPKAKQKVNNI